MSAPSNRQWDYEIFVVICLAAGVSVVAFLAYFQRGEILLYGDAVAHINIARRVFDSRTPGLLQLGTVWLPLPHLLIVPFILSDAAWISGLGGSIPSLIAYVWCVIGVFRLVRGSLSPQSAPEPGARAAAWLAAGIVAANPNLIYLQSTAMTEPLYLAFFIWSAVHFSEAVQARESAGEDGQPAAAASLIKCGGCVLGACLTRYDGWFLAFALCVAALIVVPKQTRGLKVLHRGLRGFVLLAVAGPTLWIAYNAIVYRNPLEFANGPYSAEAIEQKSATPGSPAHPGANNLAVAGEYFLKAAEINVAEGDWGRLWLGLAVAGAVLAVLFNRRSWPLLLLWIPLPFYMLSVAYSGVPIFLPVWWPFSDYNVRYGVELLPALAVFVALVTYLAGTFARNHVGRAALVVCALALVAGSYVRVWREHPVCFVEAWVNSRTRLALERELASTLRKLPHDANLLMYTGDHVGALQDAGIPLRRVINEGNHRTWRQPSDPQGLWERALANPAANADYVIAFDHDAVATHAKLNGLHPIAEIHATGQPAVRIYSTR